MQIVSKSPTAATCTNCGKPGKFTIELFEHDLQLVFVDRCDLHSAKAEHLYMALVPFSPRMRFPFLRSAVLHEVLY